MVGMMSPSRTGAFLTGVYLCVLQNCDFRGVHSLLGCTLVCSYIVVAAFHVWPCLGMQVMLGAQVDQTLS